MLSFIVYVRLRSKCSLGQEFFEPEPNPKLSESCINNERVSSNYPQTHHSISKFLQFFKILTIMQYLYQAKPPTAASTPMALGSAAAPPALQNRSEIRPTRRSVNAATWLRDRPSPASRGNAWLAGTRTAVTAWCAIWRSATCRTRSRWSTRSTILVTVLQEMKVSISPCTFPKIQHIMWDTKKDSLCYMW